MAESESEAYLRLILDSSVDGLYGVDREGATTFCNAAFLRMMGFAREEDVIGLKLHSVIHHSHPDGSAYVEGECPIYRSAATGEPVHVSDEVFFRLDGVPIPVEYWVRPIVYDGVLQGAVITFVDVSERKRAERRQAALLELGDRLREMSSSAAMAAAAAELLGRTLGVARTGYGSITPRTTLVEVERDWCSDQSVSSIAGKHDLRRYGTFFHDLQHGKTIVIPDIGADPRTAARAAELAALQVTALLNVPLMEQGDCVAVLFAHDKAERVWTEDEITLARTVADRTWAAMEQAHAEADLRRMNETLEAQVQERTQALLVAEARQRAMFDTTRQLVCVLDLDGVLMDCNRAALSAVGARLSDVAGQVFWTGPWFSGTPESAAVIETAFAAAKGGETREAELALVMPDGSTRIYDFAVRPVRDAAGRIIEVVPEATEITEQRRIEDHLRQSQKMEAVGQLTGGLAHDFNNLLTGIIGSLELLQERLIQGRLADLPRYITAAQGASRRAAALTHRLLAFSRRQTLDPKLTDINRLVTGMEDLIRRTAGPAITVEVVGAAGLWTTLIDPGQLENALLNLCINARDAMPDGGRMTIETANKWLDERSGRERDLPPGQYLSLCVSDTGSGMAPEIIRRAFDPFFTTKPIGQGTGLGLSMVYGFARQSGGQVRIYSELGAGATVCLYLPRHHGQAAEIDVPLSPSETPKAESGQTVLVIDDEPTVRMLIREVLEEFGYSAIEAADGPSGLAVLRSDARIDLLITDVGLPGGMNGRQVADAGRAVRPGLKVLFITGYAENAAVGNGHLEPGMQVLTKPFPMEALASRINDLLA